MPPVASAEHDRLHVHAATPEGRWIDLPPDLSERLLNSMDAATLEEIERATGSKIVRVSVQLTIDPA